MRKVFSWIFLILTILILVFDIYFAISGSIDVQKNLDYLAENSGASGVDYFGVGADILVLGVIVISIIGLVFAVIACLLSRNLVRSIISYVTMACFSLPILFSLFFFMF